MSQSITEQLDGMPSVFPTDEEIRAWGSLSRDEQLARLRAVLVSEECNTESSSSMEEIRQEAIEELKQESD